MDAGKGCVRFLNYWTNSTTPQTHIWISRELLGVVSVFCLVGDSKGVLGNDWAQPFLICITLEEVIWIHR